MIELIYRGHKHNLELTHLIKAFLGAEDYKEVEQPTSNCFISVILQDTLLKVEYSSENMLIVKKRVLVKENEKNNIKRFVYKVLMEATGKQLEWGTLTGIRPTKLAMKYLEKGLSLEEIRDRLKKEYLVSDGKIDLMLKIIQKEAIILSKLVANSYSLYVGIPFCPSRCLYCSFPSFKAENDLLMEEYVEALLKELRAVAQLNKNKILKTVYIGGGTPTTLTDKQLEKVLFCIENEFNTNNVEEFTVEAGRPDTISIEKLEVIKRHRVNRISINPQTMNQTTLDLIGRGHTVAEFIEAYKLARQLGFDNINMDIIIGLPRETVEDVKNTLEQIILLQPDSITVHALAIKRASRLAACYDNYEAALEQTAQSMQKLSFDLITQAGLMPYYLYRQKSMVGNLENIGYAIPSKEGIYNSLIIEESHTIIAVGAGASTKLVDEITKEIERIENVKDVRNYIDRIDEMIQRKNIFEDRLGRR